MELYKAYNLKDESGENRQQDGLDVLGLGLIVKVITKADDLPDDTIRMVASTEDTDRVGDIIRAEGWNLENYLKNAVILAFHNHMAPAIAFAPNTRVEDKLLIGDWIFDADYRRANPVSELMYQGYKLPNGPFNASSVGFISEESQPIDEEKEEENPFMSIPTEFIRQELLEVSAVNVPANPYALQQLQAKGLNTRPLEEMLQHFEGFYIDIKADDLRTPEEWDIHVNDGMRIHDPDGWRKNDGRNWDDPITLEEFNERRIECTMCPTTRERECMKCEDTKHLTDGEDICDVCKAEGQKEVIGKWNDKLKEYGIIKDETFSIDEAIAKLEGEGFTIVEPEVAVDIPHPTLDLHDLIPEPPEPVTLTQLIADIEPLPEPEPSLDEATVAAVSGVVLAKHLEQKVRKAVRQKLGIITEEDLNE